MGLMDQMRKQSTEVPCPVCEKKMKVTLGDLMDDKVKCPHCGARGKVDNLKGVDGLKRSIKSLEDTMKRLGGK